MAETTLGGGGFFGGLASGISDAQTQALADQKQRQVEMVDARDNAIKQIDSTIQHIAVMAKAAGDAGNDPQKILAAAGPLIASAQGLAKAAGIDPEMITQRATIAAMRPVAEDADSKKKLVTTSGGLGEPDRMHVFDERKGTITPIDPKTGQPMAAPAAPQAPGQPILGPSDVIPPGQAQRVNAPTPQPIAPVAAAAPVEDASLPPNAQLTQGPIESRFAEPTAVAPVNHNVNNDAIEKYSPKAQALIKGVADGTIDPSKAFSKKMGKDGESELTKFLGAVKEYDPSFDTANAPARAATLKAFKSGVEARKLSALGTVVGHITELKKDGEALDNWKSDTFGPMTKTANQLRTWVQENKQSPIIRRFDLSATAVSNELENAFRGNTTAISGIQEWRKSINPTMSSDEIAESSKKLGSLLLARMSELKEQWDRGMGHNQDATIAIKLVKTRELLEKMSAGTLLSDREVNKPNVQPLKDKYGLD